MTPPRQLRTLLIASLIGINLLVFAFGAYFLQQSRKQYELRAELLTQNIAGALEQSVSGSVERIDQALRTVVDELERQLAAGKLDETAMNAFLLRHQERMPEVEAFRVANADGLVVLGKGLVKSERASWADRDYFVLLRGHPEAGLQISQPRMGRVAKQHIVGFARRYNYPDGRFAGVVSAPVAVDRFAQLLAQFDLGPHGVIVLRDADLRLISRIPALPDQAAGQVGNASVSAELRQMVKAGVATATYNTPRGADGSQRLLTFRRLAKAPMIVLAGISEESYLADWHVQVKQTSAMGLGFLALSLLAGTLLLHQLRRAEQREKMLSQSLANQQHQHEALRRLNEIAALTHLPLAEQLQQALQLGTRLFGLEFGIVSQVSGDTYRILAQVSPPDTLHDGQEFPFGITYCNITLDSGEVVAIAQMATSPFAHHPCYSAFKLEAYIGAPIRVDGMVFGTVNFSSPNPYRRDFDDTDTEFVSLLARWVGATIERERAQQDLAASQRQLQSIIETEPECVKVLAPDGCLLQMNRAGLGMIEADSPEQVVGRCIFDIIAPNDRAAFVALNTRVNRGESGSLAFEIVGLKGTHRWLETHAVPMRDNAGRIVGQLAVTRDITERRKTEAELEQHRRHLEELVEQRTSALLETEARASHIIQASADGLYGIDADGQITFINPAACEMLGYTPEQVIGKSCHALFHHSRADGSTYLTDDCPSLRSIRLGETVRVDDEVYWRADGRALPVMYSTHPIVQAGKTVGAVTSFVDMSAQRAASEAREQALLAAENLARVRSEFLANMSHEIRTPLNGVLGFADIGYRNYNNSEKARNAFAKILTSGKRLLGVINDVLDFSKIEAGKLTIEQTDVVIAEVVDHAIDLVRERAESKQLALKVELAPGLPATCLSDPLRIGQVLLNLLSNAIKFTEQGTVSVDVALEAGRLVFRVRDSGIGMTESQLANLFNPFQQADASASRKFGGTGLGLAISKRIIELMHGWIQVHSQPDIGTTVVFQLPYHPVEASPIADSALRQPEHPAARPLAGLSFLVAEDEVINQTILEENLREDGARVVTVGNGREAVERIERDGTGAYDFVLMDIQMPEMDGYEACRRILDLAPDLPIIAQTAHAFSEERERCLAAGMIGHLAKPIDMQALLDLVARHQAGQLDG